MNSVLFKSLFFVPFFLFTQLKSQNITFEKTLGINQWNFGLPVQQTADGGFMLFGQTGNNLGSYQSKMLMVKTNAYGDTLWSKTFGPDSTINFGISEMQTLDRGFILCGSFDGIGHDSLALVKTDENGNVIWQHTYKSTSTRDVGESVIQTDDDGYLACGFASDGITDKIYIVKTDFLGDMQWSKIYPSTHSQDGLCIKSTGNGYAICGTTSDSGYGKGYAYLMKINLNGDTMWTKQYGSTAGELCRAFYLTNDGGFIIVGNEYFPGGDILLFKTDSSGNQQWMKKYGGSGWDFGYDVKQCRDGGYVIAGRLEITPGDNRFYCFKTDTGGIVMWEHAFSSDSLGDAYSVWQNDDNGYVFLGYKSNVTHDGNYLFYVRLDSSGILSVPFITSASLNNMIIYPDPVTSVSNVLLNTYFKEAELTINDMLGKELYRRRFSGDRTIIEKGNLKSEVYFIRVSNGERQYIQKIVVE